MQATDRCDPGHPSVLARIGAIPMRTIRRAFWIGATLPLYAALVCSVALPLAGHDVRNTAQAPASDTQQPAPDAPPPVEPLTFEALSPDDARLLNARIPFAATPGPTARAFPLRGDTASQARAADCLAAAMWYEAGNDDIGQRAVAQVVLNRVRHAAFPATVCGVVFQGAERRTGCQFTFTCDGAMARVPDRRSFAQAQARAWQMLSGAVVGQVGLATHYHTDWVHPVWSGEMEKLAAVDTHLFFRWHGRWGEPGAYARAYRGGEPVIGALAALSPAHRGVSESEIAPVVQSAVQDVLPLAGTDGPSTAPALPRSAPSTTEFAIEMMPGGDGSRQAFQAVGKCASLSVCKVVGRVEGKPDIAFVYLKSRRERWIDAMFWNCEIFPRSDPKECIGAAARARL